MLGLWLGLCFMCCAHSTHLLPLQVHLLYPPQYWMRREDSMCLLLRSPTIRIQKKTTDDDRNPLVRLVYVSRWPTYQRSVLVLIYVRCQGSRRFHLMASLEAEPMQTVLESPRPRGHNCSFCTYISHFLHTIPNHGVNLVLSKGAWPVKD
jgi:hypothetical protein